MDQKAFFSTLFFFAMWCISFGQNLPDYDVNNPVALATGGGYTYTEGHFQKGLRFVEFLVDQRLTAQEVQAGREESVAEFRKNPAMAIQQTETLDRQMQQVYQLTDPVQIALVRSALLAQFQYLFNQTTEQPVVRQLIDKYCPVLAFDPYAGVAFTQKDYDGMVNLMKFQAGISGQPFYLDEATYRQYREQLVQQFLNGSPEVRQSMAVMGVVSEYLLAWYAQLDDAGQQQFRNAMLAQMPPQQNYQPVQPGNQQPEAYSYDVQWPEGVNTKAEKQAYLRKRQEEINFSNYYYNTMSNMLTENHATMLNVIENLGGGDDYWKVKYNDW